MRTQDFELPGCCDGTCTSITKVPADLKTSMTVTGPIRADRQELIAISNFEKSVVLNILCMKELELFLSFTDSLVMYNGPFSTVHANAACSETLRFRVWRFTVVASSRVELVACFAVFAKLM